MWRDSQQVTNISAGSHWTLPKKRKIRKGLVGARGQRSDRGSQVDLHFVHHSFRFKVKSASLFDSRPEQC